MPGIMDFIGDVKKLKKDTDISSVMKRHGQAAKESGGQFNYAGAANELSQLGYVGEANSVREESGRKAKFQTRALGDMGKGWLHQYSKFKRQGLDDSAVEGAMRDYTTKLSNKAREIGGIFPAKFEDSNTVATIRNLVEMALTPEQRQKRDAAKARAMGKGEKATALMKDTNFIAETLGISKPEALKMVKTATSKEEFIANIVSKGAGAKYGDIDESTIDNAGKAWERIMQVSGKKPKKIVAGAKPGATGTAPSQADLEFTAKEMGITVEEVRKRLEAKQKNSGVGVIQ